MYSPSWVKLGKRLESPAAGTSTCGFAQPPSPAVVRVSSDRLADPGESPPRSEYASNCPVGDQSGLVPAGTGRVLYLPPFTASNSAIRFPTVATTRASSGE